MVVQVALLREIAANQLEQVIAVGDGANDLPRRLSTLPVWYCVVPSPVKKNAARPYLDVGATDAIPTVRVRDRTAKNC